MNMPPLPEHEYIEGDKPLFTADQMHAYARAYAEQETASIKAELMSAYEDGEQTVKDAAEILRQLRAAEQETAALRADAERYRWLREKALTIDTVADPDNFVQVWTGTDPAFGEVCFRGRTIDAAIDAAMAAKKP